MSEVSEKFPKAKRVLQRGHFRRAYETGRKVQARYFTAFVLANGDAQSRLGITATRKMGNAVARNRARRLVREVFRKNQRLVPSGIDIIINVKSALAEVAYKDLESDFISFLERTSKQ
ncbi:MAG: ribonuclease P protein component [Acidobacteria bacterium]|nr:ribonuclease P protein component [Acidobacteriota bacterium]